MKEERPLSTADLAKADEVRGHREDEMIGRETVVEREPAPPPAPPSPPRDIRPAAPQPPLNAGAGPVERLALFPDRDAVDFRKRWTDVQTGFVDEPRRAVEQADALVADVMKRLAESFAAERASLEKQWDRGDNVTTEDLRLALQRYRSFFDRLLTV
jgi:hypothetical protein